MMALLLAATLPLTAFAVEADISQGNVAIDDTYVSHTKDGAAQKDPHEGSVTVIQSDKSTPASNRVTIDTSAGSTVNVTLSGVNIDTGTRGGAAVEIKGNGDVVIELDGSNTVQSGDKHAGVEKNTIAPTDTDSGSGNGNLTITDKNGTQGSLQSNGGSGGAGIGGGEAGNGSNITISGGTVTATSGGYGAGIGGGYNGTGSNINISGGTVEANGGTFGAGIGGGFNKSGSDITIEGSAEVTANGGSNGSGIGGGTQGNGSEITITGSAEVTAKGGDSGSGIGGGSNGDGNATGSDITVSQDARVKAQGGNQYTLFGKNYRGAGAAIGDGGEHKYGTPPSPGNDVTPNTDELTPNGKIEYYAPGANMETGAPYKTVTGTYVPPQPTEPVQSAQPEEEAPQIAAPYRVVGQDGKNLACKKAQSSGVLTITVDADFATLTGSASGLKTLKAQGVETVVFVTTGATSTFALADLLAQVPSGSTYALTHVGSTVTLTLSSGMDISSILK